MTPLELQQLFIYHNDHMWLSWTVPCCIYTISRSDMTYGDSLGQCVCRLWYGITSWNSSINIQAHVRTVIWVQNGYTVPLHVPDCKMSKIYQNDQCGYRGTYRYHICVGCMLYRIDVQPYDPSRTSVAFDVPQRSHVAVLDCPALYIRHSKVGHDSLGHVTVPYMRLMPTILHQRVAL